MATEQTLTTLIINKVDSKETFNKMKAQGLVNENELYLTPEGAATDQQIKVQNNEPANAVANDLWLDLDEDAPASLPISGGTLTGPLAMSNNKITGVSDPTSAQDVATKNYVDKSNLTFTGTYDGDSINITAMSWDPTDFLEIREVINNGGTVKLVLTGDAIPIAGALTLYATGYSDETNILLFSTTQISGCLMIVEMQNDFSFGVVTFGEVYYYDDITGETNANFELPVEKLTISGTINVLLKDNYDYTFNNVSTLNLTAGTGSCHGFITFGSSKPTISLSGFTKIDGDIANAAASTVWEFSCYNKYAVFKNWSEV